MGKDKELDILNDDMSLDDLDSLIDGLENSSESENFKLEIPEATDVDVSLNLDDVRDMPIDLSSELSEVALPEVSEVALPELSEEQVAEQDRQRFTVSPELQISMSREEADEPQMAETEEYIKQNMVWYSGNISDKSYEVSFDNMPEFLEPNNEIGVINVMVDSAYGWNVFFDNGVFMNLRDLKEYQVRNGKMPASAGRIIYGNKTVSFERIKRIVVYEKPSYFTYQVK